jgi:hypothetical protein
MSMTSHIERLEWLGKKDTRAFVWYAYKVFPNPP